MLVSAPGLTYHVLRIVLVCTKEQVLWIYTRRVVTPVTDYQPIGYWSVVKLVGYPMCRMLGIRQTKTAVPLTSCSSNPFPATVSD